MSSWAQTYEDNHWLLSGWIVKRFRVPWEEACEVVQDAFMDVIAHNREPDDELTYVKRVCFLMAVNHVEDRLQEKKAMIDSYYVDGEYMLPRVILHGESYQAKIRRQQREARARKRSA